jgi:hypothetical protein
MTTAYLETLTHWGVNFAFWSALSFAVFSGVVWPWWKSQWGVNIVLLELAIAFALAGPVLSVDFSFHTSTSHAFAWVQLTALWLVGIIIFWRGFLVLSTQLKGTYGTGLRGVFRKLRRVRSLGTAEQEAIADGTADEAPSSR